MTIETRTFDSATLRTACGARLLAQKVIAEEGEVAFYVSTVDCADCGEHPAEGTGWYFDAEGCREAAFFFTMLAKEIEREQEAAEDAGYF